jgi:hypothetical protein
MRIEYTCEDCSRTLAKWPSMALQHWLGRSYPTRPIENPEPFKLYVVGSPVPNDDHERFLTLVYAEIERRWNKTPASGIVLPNPRKKHGGKKIPCYSQGVFLIQPDTVRREGTSH